MAMWLSNDGSFHPFVALIVSLYHFQKKLLIIKRFQTNSKGTY